MPLLKKVRGKKLENVLTEKDKRGWEGKKKG